ncbi:MAG: guanylate kinase [Gemmatimonadetes bacterium]|nr:guanylate kinase [Gemmatimonadota bacterium]NNM06035.1 guanylate kinase [Gemmatimonadota bacterium]
MSGAPPTAWPVVLSAPSGVGKTTIARALVETEEDFAFSVSATTREPRRGEVHGVDYWFLSEAEFLAMVEDGGFAEWAEVHGDFYGTPKESLLRAGRGGRHVVLDIDVQGALQIREAVPEALLLFILPPSVESLFRRLTGRGTEKEATLRRRLNTALHELEAAAAFDFFVINEDLEQAVSEVRELARGGGAPPEGPSGRLEDARELLEGIKGLLQQEQLVIDN